MAQFSRDCAECLVIVLHLLLQGLWQKVLMLCEHSGNRAEGPAIAIVVFACPEILDKAFFDSRSEVIVHLCLAMMEAWLKSRQVQPELSVKNMTLQLMIRYLGG